jgi:acyl dehydratase
MNWKLGDPLHELGKEEITTSQLQAYAEASGDFNPIHLDPLFAQEAGYSSVIAHGMLSMAFIADGLVFNFPEREFRVEHFSCRFKKVTFPGDKLKVKGQIKKVQQENQSFLVSIWTENQKGEVTSQGEALVIPLNA